MDGTAEARRRFARLRSEGPAANVPADTPAIRRKAPRNVSVIFMMFFLLSNHVGTAALGCPVERSSTSLCIVSTRARDFYPSNQPSNKKAPPHRSTFQIGLPNAPHLSILPKQRTHST